MRNRTNIFGWSVILLVILLASQPLLAQGKKGPRASASAATVCDVVGSDFVVEVRVRDKTSGTAIPVLAAWNIDALYKSGRGPWANQTVFASSSDSGLTTPIPTTIGPIAFDLCIPDGLGGFVINPQIAGAQGLNASADTTYGNLNTDTGAVEDQRTIMNMCSDDLVTEDVIEPSGIKLTGDVLDAISNACLAK